MGRKQKLTYALGVLLTCGAWLWAGTQPGTPLESAPLEAASALPSTEPSEAAPPETGTAAPESTAPRPIGEANQHHWLTVDCGTYWKETRGLSAHKVVLGVPFYARPSWTDYGAILASVPLAGGTDHTAYNGMEVYYNGVDTITEKTRYAKENLGGVMIWELTQDAADPEKSLLQAIGRAAG